MGHLDIMVALFAGLCGAIIMMYIDRTLCDMLKSENISLKEQLEDKRLVIKSLRQYIDEGPLEEPKEEDGQEG